MTERVEAPACLVLELMWPLKITLLSLLDSSTPDPYWNLTCGQLRSSMARCCTAPHRRSNSPISRVPIISVLATTEQGADRRDFHCWPRGNDRFVFDPRHYDFVCRMRSFKSEAKLCASRLRKSTASGDASESFQRLLRCSICPCSHKLSNRLPARRSIKLKVAQQGGFSSAGTVGQQ